MRPVGRLRATAARARELGFTPLILRDCIEGAAREVAEVHAGIALSVLRYDEPIAGPAILLVANCQRTA